MERKTSWKPSQIKFFVKQIRSELTPEALKWMTPRVRAAIVSDHVLGIIRAQDKEMVSVSAIDELYDAINAELSGVLQ